MIWVRHDFYENFTKSSSSNDIELLLDIFRSEISDLLTYNTSVLFNLFDKVGIKYNKKSSYEELFDKIIVGIKQNPKFVNGLSFLISESNKTLQDKNDKTWVVILNKITSGIKKIANYFTTYPKQEKLFKIKTLEMLETKSSVLGDDDRKLRKKDNTIYWILGIAVVGVVGYLIWRHYDKLKQEKLRAESLNRINGSDLSPELKSKIKVPDAPSMPMANTSIPNTPTPQMQEPILDPAYYVPPDVLIPDTPVPNPMSVPNNNSMGNMGGGVQIINVQPNTTPKMSSPSISNQRTSVDI